MATLNNNRLEFDLPLMPPSSNSIYFTDWIHKRRGLSEEAKKFKAQFKQHFHKNVLRKIAFKDFADKEATYKLELTFYVESIVNKGWPQTKTKFKKIDLSNRVKLLEDCLAEATGLDDSQTVTIILNKIKTDNDEHILIALTRLTEVERGQENEQKSIARRLSYLLKKRKGPQVSNISGGVRSEPKKDMPQV